MNDQPKCPCDAFVHPRPLAIDAGLPSIPRQIATFPQFRHAMLSALPTKPALAHWRARGDEDLGVMLIEMWAYVCDVVTFYDETFAHEAYLRTARLSPSVRKLVALLGYRPRPAVAARAHLAIKADGRAPLLLPAGLAFRSAAFDGQPPQVFELDVATRVHPLLNGWSLAPTRPKSIAAGSSSVLVTRESARARVGDHLLFLQAGGALVGDVRTATAVTSVNSVNSSDRGAYRRIDLDSALATELVIAGARVVRPTATTTLWTNPSDTSNALGSGVKTLILSGVVPTIKAPSLIIASNGAAAKVFHVSGVSQVTRHVAYGASFPVPPSTTPTSFDVRVPVTQLTLTTDWPGDAAWLDAAKITLEYAFDDAGALTAELAPRIQPGDALHLLPPVEAPPDGTLATSFLVADADGLGLELTGGVDFAARTINLAQGSSLTAPLDPPVAVHGNVVAVTRGETVPRERLGVGNGSTPNQRFTLKKKPLTYVSAPTTDDPNGAKSTLRVEVRGVAWREVPSFFGVAPDATAYIVRQDEDGQSTITFGDGARGARLPSGAEIVATYRFGAGLASPPAGGITQLGKPVKQLTSVKNPVAAFGGADTQPAAQVRSYAPRSALLLGRAVSLADMEALAAGQPGVRAVQAEWAWDTTMQLPAVQLRYIGDAAIAGSLRKSIRAATAPSTPIEASPATPKSATLSLDLLVDRRYHAASVETAVEKALTTVGVGLLSPERIGIGTPLYRSAVLAEALAVEGVTSVRGIHWNGAGFEAYAQSPGSGAWFQVTLTVSATEDQNG
jgi:hypothetical protein